MARQVLILLATHVLLIWILQMVNHALSPWKLHLLLPGLLITFAALNLRAGPALLTVGLTGLWVDAAGPAPFGVFTVIYLLVAGILFRLRIQWHREQRREAYSLCHLANFLAVCAAALLLGGPGVLQGTYWLRLAIDLALSHLILFPLAPWFFKLQLRSLEIAGVDLSRDPDSH